ncbi:MAG: F0F1 ATP synthase subunit B [Alphaproteobacteria bacterium]
MKELLDNPYFWSGVSLLLFLVIAVKFGRAPILAWLDGGIGKIRDALAEAERLKAEAAQTLALYKQKQQEAIREAETIIAQAGREAEAMRAAAAKELQETLARREQQAVERIAQAEAAAVAEVRRATIDLAASVSEKILRERLSPEQAGIYIDRALAALPVQAKKSA